MHTSIKLTAACYDIMLVKDVLFNIIWKVFREFK